jgi:hypothetical protein
MELISRIGMDTSKHIFQLHGVNAAEEQVLRKKLRRKEMAKFFEDLPPRYAHAADIKCVQPGIEKKAQRVPRTFHNGFSGTVE